MCFISVLFNIILVKTFPGTVPVNKLITSHICSTTNKSVSSSSAMAVTFSLELSELLPTPLQ